MGAKEFFTAIDMLDTYNRIMNITEKEPPKQDIHLDTRELGRYRMYVYQEKMLRREILEVTAGRLRSERIMKTPGGTFELEGRDHRRERARLIDLYLELSKVCAKRKGLEQQYERIESPFVRKVVRHRYFSDTTKRLVSWAQTAKELELPITGAQLQSEITSALQ